jgi:cytochrome c oxidase subunit III
MTEPVTLRPPYSEPRQQHEADLMGMYLFLGSEIMLFGGLFAAMALTRLHHPAEYVAASHQMHLWIGAANTLILLTSSLCAAFAVATARNGAASATAGWLIGTAGLGLGFLGFKLLEYTLEYRDGVLPVPGGDANLTKPVETLFMHLYLIATGLHAIHLSIGIALMAGLAVRARRRSLALPGRAVTVEIGCLYWHLVDVIWVFLYPVLYLAR